MVKIKINHHRRRVAKEKKKVVREVTHQTYLAQLDLPVRIINKLESVGLFTLEDLLQMNQEDVLLIRQINSKSLEKILDAVVSPQL